MDVKVFEINENGATGTMDSNLEEANCNRPGGFLWGSNGKSACKC